MCGNRAVHRTPNFLEKLDIQMSISTRPKKKKNKAETPRKTPHTKKTHRAAEWILSVPEGVCQGAGRNSNLEELEGREVKTTCKR